jgi:hypothetical protein
MALTGRWSAAGAGRSVRPSTKSLMNTNSQEEKAKAMAMGEMEIRVELISGDGYARFLITNGNGLSVSLNFKEMEEVVWNGTEGYGIEITDTRLARYFVQTISDRISPGAKQAAKQAATALLEHLKASKESAEDAHD